MKTHRPIPEAVRTGDLTKITADERALLEAWYGLDGGEPYPLKDLCTEFSVGPDTLRAMRRDAEKKLAWWTPEATEARRLFESTLPILGQPIFLLALSPRVENALRRLFEHAHQARWGSIPSVQWLCGKTEADLMNAHRFGAKALAEVKSALAARGLALKDET
jgi:hypothetical protein